MFDRHCFTHSRVNVPVDPINIGLTLSISIFRLTLSVDRININVTIDIDTQNLVLMNVRVSAVYFRQFQQFLGFEGTMNRIKSFEKICNYFLMELDEFFLAIGRQTSS